MSGESAAGLPPLDDVRSRAAEMLRALAADLRAARRDGDAAQDTGARAALAAVEALETLAETVEAMLPLLPETGRTPLTLAVRGGWERLAAAGIHRDGAVGERLDLTRHRVLRTRPADGEAPGEVVEVIAPGIVFEGRRLREAAVCVAGERS